MTSPTLPAQKLWQRIIFQTQPATSDTWPSLTIKKKRAGGALVVGLGYGDRLISVVVGGHGGSVDMDWYTFRNEERAVWIVWCQAVVE